MIDQTHPLSVVRQCQLLGMARSTAYYQPPPVLAAVLTLMRRIDELHLQYPFSGARNVARPPPVRKPAGRSAPRGHPHASHGNHGRVPQAPHQSTASRPPDLSLPAAPADHHTSEPRLGVGYHVHSDAARLSVSLCHSGLGQPPGVSVAALQLVDDGLLCGSRARGDDPVRQTGDLQY